MEQCLSMRDRSVLPKRIKILINKKVKITIYSFFESFTQKDEMIKELEKYLNELKKFDNVNDKNVSRGSNEY